MVSLLLREGIRRGAPADELLDGVAHPLDFLQDKDERIDWDEFVQIMRNLGRRWSMDDFAVFGASFFDKPLFRPFRAIARLLNAPSDLYVWQARPTGPGPQLFTCVESVATDIEPGGLTFAIRIWEGYQSCPEFFAVSLGCMRGCTRLIGLPPAEVIMTQTAYSAMYRIKYVERGGSLRDIWRTLMRPFRLGLAAGELREAHTTLRQRYHQLQTARAQLDQQAKLLRTANRISQVVHGEMDLGRTLQTVVAALVEVAGFAAADLSIATDVDGQRVHNHARTGLAVNQVDAVCLPVVVRAAEVGTLRLWTPAAADIATAEIVEFLMPTIYMAIDDALAFRALLQYRNQLEDKVEQRTAELEQARVRLTATVDSLREAQAARDRIFANINHEIRTPLALMMLATGSLKDQLPLDHPDIENIETSSRRLLDLVDGLLLLAAGQEGKLKLAPVFCDMAGTLKAITHQWQAAAREGSLSLAYQGPQRCHANIDPKAFERMISNLVSNAVKFTPEGGRITLALEETPTQHVITTRDTGIGIDAAFRRRIFGRFEQGRPAVRGGIRGSGIGLSLVKELALAHQGQVSVDDNPGGGTVFTLTLPRGTLSNAIPAEAHVTNAVADAPMPHAAGAVFGPAFGAEATILVAEDETSLREAIAKLLSPTYRVMLAENGITALELAQKHLPDVLISDVQMPEMDGIELSRRFRALPGNRLAPVLLLTAHGSLATRLAGFEAGAVDYIAKPFEPAELLARLRSQLQLRNLALRLSESEKLASLGVLSAGLAHELRNPANAVVNAIEPLCELLPTACLLPNTPTAELLGVIKEGAVQLRALSQQLLGFTRPGQLLFHEENLENLLSRAFSMVHESLRGIEVRRELKFTGTLWCAGPLLVQVLTNLLENAAHAAGRDGWIVVATRVRENWAVFEVGDSGPGVPLTLRERIFEPFFTTKPPGSGTGLGLSTARTILERHHGTLSLVDGAGGAVFRMELPLERPRTQDVPVSQQASGGLGS